MPTLTGDLAANILARLPEDVRQFDHDEIHDERNVRKGLHGDTSYGMHAPWLFRSHTYLSFPDGRTQLHHDSEPIDDPSFVEGCNAEKAYEAWKGSDGPRAARDAIDAAMLAFDIDGYRCDRIAPAPCDDDYTTRFAPGELVAHPDHPGMIGTVMDPTRKSGHERDTAVKFCEPGETHGVSYAWKAEELTRLTASEIYALLMKLGSKHKAEHLGEIVISEGRVENVLDIFRDRNGFAFGIHREWAEQCASEDDDGRTCIVSPYAHPRRPEITILNYRPKAGATLTSARIQKEK